MGVGNKKIFSQHFLYIRFYIAPDSMPSCYTTLQDPLLFDLLKEDEEGAFREIYERYFDVLYLHACRKLENREEARDVVQEVFATIWDKRKSLSLTGSLLAYLYAAVRNRIINIFLHKRVEAVYIESLESAIDEGFCQTDHLIRRNQLNSMIEIEIAALPSKMQEIFKLSRKQYFTHREIASELNLSEQTVRKQVNNALKILRSKLGVVLVNDHHQP